MATDLDVIAIGRSSVELYGGQIGGRFEDMRSFEKRVGGASANVAIAVARLGLTSAVLTCVGDEPLGRFVRERLRGEGVDVVGVIADPRRTTPLAVVDAAGGGRTVRVEYCENSAGVAFDDSDVDPALIGRARAVLATAADLNNRRRARSTMRALTLARESGARTVLLLGAGFGAAVPSAQGECEATEAFLSAFGAFDLIIGTEDAFLSAGGAADLLAALQALRTRTQATLVCIDGERGAAAYPGVDPEMIDPADDGLAEAARAAGADEASAGVGFAAGLLAQWLDGAPWPRAIAYARACGALATRRVGGSPAYPSRIELDVALKRRAAEPAFCGDAALEQLHWATTRTGDWSTVRIFAFDHRAQFEEMAGATPAKIAAFKELCLKACVAVAEDRPGYGLLCDNRLGRDALFAAAGRGLWIGRPVESPGSRPLTLEPEIGADCGGLAEWPTEHVVKVLCFCHPDDDEELWRAQSETIQRLFRACRRNGLEFLLEVIPSKVGPVTDETVGRLIDRIYQLGVYPDWWKLEPMRSDAAWANACGAIERNDPHVRGVVVLGLGAEAAALEESFRAAAQRPLVRGFAVGRTIFGDAARGYLSGRTSADDAVADMTQRYRALAKAWDAARGLTDKETT